MRVLERSRAWLAVRKLTPLSTSSAEGDHVRVTGNVRVLDEIVIAPITGRDCVISRSRVRGTGYVPPPPAMLQTRPFVVETAADEDVIVDSGAVLLGVAASKLWPDDEERMMAFATRYAVKLNATSWFEEVIVAPGDRITVGGVLMHDLNPEPPWGERAFRDRPTPGLRLVGSDEHPLVIVPAR
jgi:hypothetical protein